MCRNSSTPCLTTGILLSSRVAHLPTITDAEEAAVLVLNHRYRCHSLLSHIGARYVWKAEDLLFHRLVVVKAALLNEANIHQEFIRLRQNAHPQLVAVFDLGRDQIELPTGRNTVHFFTQEWLSGPNLHVLAGQLDEPSLILLARQVLELLAFLHHRHLTRLDLKPQHLFRVASGWKLIDLDQAHTHQPLSVPEAHGTLAYTAPECLTGAPGSPTADLYSLGANLFHAITGFPPPLEGTTLEEISGWIPMSHPPPLEGWAEAYPSLSAFVGRLLARSPAQRPETAEAALSLLDDMSTRNANGHAASRDLSRPSITSGHGWRLRCPMPETPLYGFDALSLKLDQWLSDTEKSRGGGLLLRSPAGGGRSRMLSYLKEQLQRTGNPVLLLPSALWNQPGSSLLSLMAAYLHLLSAESLAPTLSGESTSGIRDELELLTQSLFQLQSLAQRVQERYAQPVSILVDDVEQADTATRLVLSRLAYYLPGSGLRLLLAIRADVPTDDGLGLLPTYELPHLSDEHLRLIGEDILGPGVFRTQSEVTQLSRETQGLPGPFRRCLLSYWRPGIMDPYTESADVALVDISPDIARLAQPLSLLREPFNKSLAEGLIEQNDERSAFEILLQNNTLRVNESDQHNEPLYRLASDELRLFLTAQLEEPQRLALHLRAATLLERQQLVGTAVASSTIAHHFRLSQSPERAIPHLQLALKEARGAYRWEETSHYLFDLLSLTPEDDPVHAELSRQYGEALLQLGQLPAAELALEKALQDEKHLPLPKLVRCLGALGDVRISLGRMQQARIPLTRALTLHHTLKTPLPEYRRWLRKLVWLDLQDHNIPAIEQGLRQLTTQSGILPPTELVDQTYLEALCLSRIGVVDDRLIQRLNQALSLAEGEGTLKQQTQCLNILAGIFMTRRDFPTARRYLENLVSKARASWDPGLEAFACYNLASCQKEQCSPAEAMASFERAAQLFQRQGNRTQECKARIECLALLVDHQQLSRADEMLHRLQGLQNHADSEITITLDVFTCRLALAKGSLESLADRLLQLEVDPRLQRVPGLLPELLAMRMELALQQQQPLAAIQLVSTRLDPAHENQSPEAWRRIHALAIRAHQSWLPAPADRPSTPSPAGGQGRESAFSVSGSSRFSSQEGPAPLLPPVHLSEEPSSTVQLAPVEGSSAPLSHASLATADWLQVLQNLLTATDDDDRLASELAELAGRLFQGRGMVFLFDGSHTLVGRGYQVDARALDDVSHTILENVRESREPFICPDVRANRLLGQLQSLREARVRSVLCCPVLHDNACLGVIYLDHVEVGRVTAESALSIVTHIAQLTAHALATALQRRRQPSGDVTRFGLVGTSAPMKLLHARLEQLATSPSKDLIVLFLGETGTGKSTIARRLHEEGSRKHKPFVSINTPSINEQLFESLMLGHVRGAFTGAVADQPGWFEMARGGTLFLDEIGDMPVSQQARLLETLGGSKRFKRLGAQTEQALDVHLFSATSRELKLDVEKKLFRPELLRRISVNTCRIPPLRERGAEDVCLLARHAITHYLKRQQLMAPSEPLISLEDFVSRPARDYLIQYEWPWNVSQLENLFANEWIRTRLRTQGKDKVELPDLREALDLPPVPGWAELAGRDTGVQTLPLDLSYEALERWCGRQKGLYIQRLLEACGGNRSEVARRLGCSRDMIYKFMERVTERSDDNPSLTSDSQSQG